ncbi:MAG: hypothetical protein AABW92_02330 [Nanoarchaeota archaeon]
MLPKFYFFELSDPKAIIGGQVYKALAREEAEFPDYISIPPFFAFQNTQTFPLLPMESIAGLEELYLFNYNKQIGEWTSREMGSMKIGSLTDIDLQNRINESILLEFIVNKVLPRFTGVTTIGSSELEGLINVGKQKKKVETKDNLATHDSDLSIRSDLDQELYDLIPGLRNSEQKKGSSAVARSPPGITRQVFSIMSNRVLKGDNICIIDNKVYTLSESNDQSATQVYVDKICFNLTERMTEKRLEESFNDALVEILKTKAISNDPVISKHILIRDKCLQNISSPTYKNIGLSVRKNNEQGSSYQICLDYPEFVNRGENNNKFTFPAGTIAIEVAIDRNQNISHSHNPIILGRNKGAFIGDWATNSDVCTNNYVSKYRTPEERIVDYLITVKNVHMSGYFGNVNPRRKMTKSNFQEPEFRKVDDWSDEKIIKKYGSIANDR